MKFVKIDLKYVKGNLTKSRTWTAILLDKSIKTLMCKSIILCFYDQSECILKVDNDTRIPWHNFIIVI